MIKDLLEESNFAEVIRTLYGDKWTAESRAEGMRQATLEVLEARFSSLDEALVSAIQRLDLPALQALLPACATESLEQIRARLSLSPEAE